MKVSSPNKKAITQNAVMGVGAGAGIGLARIANQYFPEKKQTSGIAKIAVAVALMAGASAIASNDVVSNATKGVLAGASGEKLVSGVADLLADSDFAKHEKDADGKEIKDGFKETIHTALGMNGAQSCGCANSSNRYVALPALNFTPNGTISMVETQKDVFTASKFQ
jgi:hypothetical protein